MKARRCRATTAATSANGLSSPDVVSQWTSATCVIAAFSDQRALNGGGIDGFVLRTPQHFDVAAEPPRDLDHTLAIGAVRQHQQHIRRPDQRADRGFDDESAAPLQRDGDMAALAARDIEQAAA